MLNPNPKHYKLLNELAEKNGIVIFGGSEDLDIPIAELKQAFEICTNIYNRSISTLSIHAAINAYDKYVMPLMPEILLLHIGNADLDFFREDPIAFDLKYREFISHIRSQNKTCRIAIISLKNYENDSTVSEMNKHLKYIAESERCEYSDISNKRVWNPKGTKDAVSFVYSTGFMHPLKNKRSLYNLVKIFFYCPCTE